MTSFGSILTAMVTPFTATGEVDFAAADRLLEHLYTSGSDGVVVAGTTGEAATLDDEEHLAFIAHVVAATRERHPTKTVIAGVGSNDTRHAVKLTEAATAHRPDALLSVNPYYNRPSRQGILAHYRAIDAATDLPIMLYNIPQRTGADLPNAFLAELAEIDHIVAVKQANPDNLAPIDGLALYAGNDDLFADVLDMGEAGVIATATHVFGPRFRAMLDEPDRRREIHASLGEVYRTMALAPAAVTNKAALELAGLAVGGPRLPYVPLEESERAEVRDLLDRHDLLDSLGASETRAGLAATTPTDPGARA